MTDLDAGVPAAGSPAGLRRAIAVDGLSGAGKSTVSRRLASRLGWAYLDTGACYRAITVAALRAGRIAAGEPLGDGTLGDLADTALEHLDMSTDPLVSRVRLGEDDVTAEIRSEITTSTVSAVAADPDVRTAAVRWQRSMVGSAGGCVVEGRDIGTVVLPDAGLKVWLTASVDRRTSRRAAEDPGSAVTQDSIERRDQLDSSRRTDPARPAEDAIVVDTDDLDVDGVVARLLALAAERGLVPA